MATKPDDDILDLTDQVVDPNNSDDQNGADTGDDDQANAQANDDGEEETIVSFGDDPVEQDQEGDSSVIRQLRAELRETKKRLRDNAPEQPKVEIGAKPTLESCDYDEEKFETELTGWHERKRQVESQAEQQQAAAREANESWEAARQRYQEGAQKHGFSDIQDAQDAVEQALGINAPVILKAANDAALMVKALGSNPAKLAELAKIKDPFELAAAVARMEGGVKVVKKRTGPVIDKPQTGSGSLTPADPDKELEKLEKEAARTGDRTKIIQYKRQLREKK